MNTTAPCNTAATIATATLCPFTGTSFTLSLPYREGCKPARHASYSQPVAHHPLLSASLCKQDAYNLPLEWQVWRTLWSLAQAGYLQSGAPIKLLHAAPHTLAHIADDAAWLLRQHEARASTSLQEWNKRNLTVRTLPLSKLPRFAPCATDERCTGLAAWLKHCKLLSGAVEAGLTSADKLQDMDAAALELMLADMPTSQQRIAAMQEAASLSARQRAEAARAEAARTAAIGLSLQAAIAKVDDILADLAAAHKSAGWKATNADAEARPVQWTADYSTWLASLCNPASSDRAKRKLGCAPYAMLKLVRAELIRSFPDAHFVGQQAAHSLQLCLQALDAEILLQAQAVIARLDIGEDMLTPEELAELDNAQAAEAEVFAANESGALQVVPNAAGKRIAAKLDAAVQASRPVLAPASQADQPSAQPATQAGAFNFAAMLAGAGSAKPAKRSKR